MFVLHVCPCWESIVLGFSLCLCYSHMLINIWQEAEAPVLDLWGRAIESKLHDNSRSNPKMKKTNTFIKYIFAWIKKKKEIQIYTQRKVGSRVNNLLLSRSVTLFTAKNLIEFVLPWQNGFANLWLENVYERNWDLVKLILNRRTDLLMCIWRGDTHISHLALIESDF